jgi:hypothetical protein
MTEPAFAKPMKAFNRLSSVIWIIVLALFAIAFVGSGIFTGKPGPVICGVGWILLFIVPLFCKGPSGKRAALWSRIVGALIFVLGLAVHSGAL